MAGNTLALGISNAGPASSIINFYSSGGAASASGVSAGAPNGMIEVIASSGYTANTLKQLISLTGRGRINALSVYSKDATARTLRCKITIDDVVVFDATSASISSANFGMVPIGVIGATNGVVQFQPVDYNTSCLIEVASSLTEAAGNVGVGVNRETWVG